RNSFDALNASDRRLRKRLLARGDEVEVRPGPSLQSLVFRLGDSRIVRGPFLQTRPFHDREAEPFGEEECAFDAPSQGTREDGRGSLDGPGLRESADLRLAPRREGRPVEVGRVRGPDDFPVSYEHEVPGHSMEPPETTTSTRICSPSTNRSSIAIGASPRTRMCASGASRSARRRSEPVALSPSFTSCSWRAGRISATIRIPSAESRFRHKRSCLSSAERLSETSFSGDVAAQVA